jgi:hypothetical protein
MTTLNNDFQSNMVVVNEEAKQQKAHGRKTDKKSSLVLMNITQLCHSLRNGVIEMESL